jgi:acyl carrier protein
LNNPEKKFQKKDVLNCIITFLEDITSDWDIEYASIGSETLLVKDLGLKSVQMVQLVMKIESHYVRKDLPFEELFMANKGPIYDLRVSELIDFLYTHL